MHLDRRGAESARSALEYLKSELEQPHDLVRRAELGNHVVKCNLHRELGPPGIFIRDAPAVDVMPAVRQGSHLRIPERHTGRWVDTDPEELMKMVAAHRRAWSNFDGVVRIIKVWADHQHLQMKPLAVEVMVLKYLPRPGLFGTMSCSDAVARFFEAASRAHITKLADPTGRCGEIDSQVNYAALRKALDSSAGLARRAMDAERERRPVTHPRVYGQEIFGKEFPRPTKWHQDHPQQPGKQASRRSRHWLVKCAESGDERASIRKIWLWRPSGRDKPAIPAAGHQKLILRIDTAVISAPVPRPAVRRRRGSSAVTPACAAVPVSITAGPAAKAVASAAEISTRECHAGTAVFPAH